MDRFSQKATIQSYAARRAGSGHDLIMLYEQPDIPGAELLRRERTFDANSSKEGAVEKAATKWVWASDLPGL